MTSSKRVWAPKGGELHEPDLLSPAGQRERETGRPLRACTGGSWEVAALSLRHAALQQSWDVFADDEESYSQPPFHLRRRTPVQEIVAADGLVLVLAQSGVCAVYERGRQERLCWLNVEADEAVCSIFLNPLDGTVISVSTFSDDEQQALRCRATPLASLRAGRSQQWRPLFQGELLRHPGWLEICELNDKCLTLAADTRVHKVWDLARPHRPPLFEIPADAGVEEVKLTTGCALLLLRQRRAGALPLALLSLQDGRLLREWELELEGGSDSSSICGSGGSSSASPLELLEPFGQHLLVKQAGLPLRIHDLLSGGVREIRAADFGSPHTLIFLHLNSAFLAFSHASSSAPDSCLPTSSGYGSSSSSSSQRCSRAELWDLHGRRLACLTERALIPAADASTIFITRNQDLMLAYCAGSHSDRSSSMGVESLAEASSAGAPGSRAPGSAPAPTRPGSSAHGANAELPARHHSSGSICGGGCLAVWDLVRARQVAVIAAPVEATGKPAEAAAAATLRGVTSLFYDEQRQEVHVGTADGRAHVWAAH